MNTSKLAILYQVRNLINALIDRERLGGAASASGALLSEPLAASQGDPHFSSSEAPLPDQGGGWVSVSERLPDDEITVLVATVDGDVDAGFAMAGRWYWTGGISIGDDVTHWMDLPDPPTQSAARGAQGCRFCEFAEGWGHASCPECGKPTGFNGHPEAEQASGSGNR